MATASLRNAQGPSQGPITISLLPFDAVLGFLILPEVAKCRRVSREWRRVVEDSLHATDAAWVLQKKLSTCNVAICRGLQRPWSDLTDQSLSYLEGMFHADEMDEERSSSRRMKRRRAAGGSSKETTARPPTSVLTKLITFLSNLKVLNYDTIRPTSMTARFKEKYPCPECGETSVQCTWMESRESLVDEDLPLDFAPLGPCVEGTTIEELLEVDLFASRPRRTLQKHYQVLHCTNYDCKKFAMLQPTAVCAEWHPEIECPHFSRVTRRCDFPGCNLPTFCSSCRVSVTHQSRQDRFTRVRLQTHCPSCKVSFCKKHAWHSTICHHW